MNHPFIIHIYEILHDSSYFYIVMEKCNQGNIKDFAKNMKSSCQEMDDYYEHSINRFTEDVV